MMCFSFCSGTSDRRWQQQWNVNGQTEEDRKAVKEERSKEVKKEGRILVLTHLTYYTMIVQRRDVFFSTKSDQGGEDKGSEHGFKKHSTSDFVFYSLGRADGWKRV